MTIQQKQAALEELRIERVNKCQQCILAGTRTNVVFGEGNPGASLMFVGEAPGADEDAAGKPFVGRAGELLGKMIVAMGITRDDVYIANMLKCRPPENRAPAPDEIAACFPFLVRQIQIIAPKVIVTLGNPATHGLLNIDTGITKIRGQWQALPNIGEGLEGIPVMPTFHPAYVLRNYNDQTRGMVWDDLKKVMQHLGMKLPAKKA
ncbi:MAG: uracil-DNA glycosylase [Planctomycetaceae bacterium]|nr:MAG: uracil-DNA glycosylase [Planctomycetaceae bacterium]